MLCRTGWPISATHLNCCSATVETSELKYLSSNLDVVSSLILSLVSSK